MISRISGTLQTRDIDRIEVMTAGGVGYMLQIPLSVHRSLPGVGDPVELYTSLVVKEDGWQLFGFSSQLERRVFDLVRTATGVGPALALSLLSSLSAAQLVRALVEKDTATLQTVPRVGKKKAEQMILDLATRMREINITDARSDTPLAGADAEYAARALVALGYPAHEAERAVRAALDAATAPLDAAELLRSALARFVRN